MTKRDNQHRKALEKIANSPTMFDLPDPVSVAIETKLYHESKLFAEPDILLRTDRGDLHIVEYKGNGNGELAERGRKQLEKAVWWFGRYDPYIPPEKIHTHLISGTDSKYKGVFK